MTDDEMYDGFDDSSYSSDDSYSDDSYSDDSYSDDSYSDDGYSDTDLIEDDMDSDIDIDVDTEMLDDNLEDDTDLIEEDFDTDIDTDVDAEMPDDNLEGDVDLIEENMDEAIDPIQDMPDVDSDGFTENPPINSVADYYSAHDYGQEDYDTYSQDPEWRRLMMEEYPDTELPPLSQERIDSILAPYEGKMYDSVEEYVSDHNFGQSDYEIYSQDPEWRRLMMEEYPDTELPPLSQERIDSILAPYEGKMYDSVEEYVSDHNFGQSDYEIYSQDPEWRRLMREQYPDTELPPLSQERIDSILAPYEGKMYDSVEEYVSDHNFGQSDYEIYSQDPEWRRLMREQYPDTKLPPLNNGDQQSDYQNLDTWLKDINPNFDPFDVNSPYCNNCGSCAYAVYRRLEGDTNIVATANNIGYNDQMNALTGMEQVSMSPSEIESRLLEQGDGAHAIIGIDRSEGPGHWFNAVCMDGKVYAVDGQTGEINDWPPDYGDVVNWEMSIKKGDK